VPKPDADVSPTATSAYRRTIGALASRAARMGAADPEGAAQEAIRRSLDNPMARPALEYYFRDHATAAEHPPEWTLLQLLGWLHGVLRFVVWEERARVRTRREITAPPDDLVEYADASPSQLDVAIDAQLRAMVHDCIMSLAEDRRAAVLMRLQGARYDEIARRLGLNENTVATWLHRSSQELIRRVRERMSGRTSPAAAGPTGVVKASHA
jgi:Sigma-70, region 4